MDDGLRSERLALPLAEAAARLGISAEALCRRLDRGEARGFERDGTSFVYLDDPNTEDLGDEEIGAGRRFGGAAELPPGMPTDGTLPVVVEFQKLELTRLLRENERLNTRMDQLFDEIRHLRDMQQREQVLRQQEQTLRRQNQETLDRLTSRPAFPAPAVSLTPASAPNPASADRPDIKKPRPELVLTRTVSKARAPAPKSEPAPATAGDGAIGPEEAAELAMILNGIGHSLRDSEAFRRYPPIKPGSVPQRAGDRRPASVLSSRGEAPVPSKKMSPKTLSTEEAALVAILDSMGPTAEDRRTAARNVRRLLRMPTRSSEH